MSKTMFLCDSHIHLDDPNFHGDLSLLLNNARQKSIHAWIIPATASQDFENIRAIQQREQGVYAAYGLHPYFIEKHTEEDLQRLKAALQNYSAIAVGECGLDAMIANANIEKQLFFFKEQIKLALEYDLPLIIHARKTIDLILKEIRKHPSLRGVIHSFSGSLQQAEIIIQHDFLLGFGGASTFPRAQKLQSIIKTIPLDSFLIETDAPFQRGSYRDNGLNYPEDLLAIAKNIALIREDSLESIARSTLQNMKHLFKIKGLLNDHS